MTMKRYPDWKPRLIAWLAKAAGTPYRPGTHDCALFAAGAVEAMTGVDLAAGFRGTYTTVEEGFERLRAAGFADHVAMAEAHFDRIAIALAQPGDLAVLSTPDGPALGVVQGEYIYVPCAGSIGLVPIIEANHALRVN